tara:strand:- start:415 stop:1488 length:1074 start_codon:yes stop_codon:yes gene_type:complete
MDDYSINSLTESKNEWSARLVSILAFNIIEGINSIYQEALSLCISNGEENKYLMTFQNLLSKIPDWSSNTIENETKRIETVSGCKYLEDLITCVHIIQLKALTCIRTGLKQKKIDIDVPNLNKFIHKIYINTARKLYSNVDLFEKDIYPLQKQKNNREFEMLVKESILNTIRENIPIEQILRVYLDESEEQETVDELIPMKKDTGNQISENENKTTDKVDESNNTVISTSENDNKTLQEKLDEMANKINNKDDDDNDVDTNGVDTNDVDTNDVDTNDVDKNKLTIDFSDIDKSINSLGLPEDIIAPKDLDTLEQKRLQQNDNDKLDIGDSADLDIDTIDISNLDNSENVVLDDIIEL